jgi:hypothetical protein
VVSLSMKTVCVFVGVRFQQCARPFPSSSLRRGRYNVCCAER